MHIGLFCLAEDYSGDTAQSLHEQLRLVEAAERLGFDEAWFGEHHFNNFSVIPDPALMLAYAAARTQHIRLGTAGFLAPFYHPVRLAESIAVLDNLSGGRINAGFAKGGFAPDTRHFLQQKEELRSIMFETVEAVELLLQRRGVDFEGDFLQIRNSTVTPRPLQKQLPFYVATFASEATIHFAATHGYGLMMSQGATLRDCVEAQNFYRMVAGHDPEMIVMRVFAVADSDAEAQRAALPAIDHFVKCMRAAQREQPQPGFDAENYEALLRERSAFFDGQAFFENAILGNPDTCIARIDALTRALPNLHLSLKPAGRDADTDIAMLERFNAEIRPHFNPGVSL
ncbi:LLM class flavin-dependent oxidoreductase [Sulfurimonas sp. HSL-3221]|uniref:LLM class flavin-dependent oxidoreductase n=1 Tax=Sulfurimonadaceae TaxID=2771471 RepID=UPI001E540FDB|nr:LLM class flavin-dependent oxidoreductase [Sulfurimonas sp. HSL-3221]UFS62586.1 LLM class flavin-dependent oxidoreductase [Sulfurimonas sp. HSL-3221]